MSSLARYEALGDAAVLNQLTKLFSPEFYVKKEELEPFVSILNGIKCEYWDRPVKFHHAIGLLHQLKLDTSTQVLEHQQLLIKNRLVHLLKETPDLLDSLLNMIEDASNNRRHVLNARPTSLGLKAPKSQCNAVVNRSGGFARKPTFVIRNNTVTLPWQPWFAHVVPKSSAVGRTIVQLHQRKNPYSFLPPRSPPSRFAAPSQKIVTSSGLMTIRPPVATTALNLSTNLRTRHEEEFGYSRKIYKQVPPSLQHPLSETTPQGTTATQETNRQALLKKQQEFLRQLDLLKADQKDRPGCNKQLFPPNGSSKLVPKNSGDNEGKLEQKAICARSENPTIKMMTRQSFKSHIQQETIRKRRSPRTATFSLPNQTQITSKSKVAKVGKEKGLVLSRVSDHCIVISVPNQKSSTTTLKAVTKTSKTDRRKHKKKKQDKSTKEVDCATISSNERAFNRVKKIHKKRHKAWMKMVAQQKEKMEAGEPDHKEVSSKSILDDGRDSIKISSNLFKAKNAFNKNNSCSSMDSQGMNTPGNHKYNILGASSNVSSEAANISSLVSPSCYVSLTKMKLDPNTGMRLNQQSQVNYEVGSNTSFPYNQELTMPFPVHSDPDEMASSQDSMMSYPVSDHTYSADGEDSQESIAYGYDSLSGYYPYTCDMPMHEATENNVEGLAYVTHANSFLKRLLVTPSPPKSIQKQKRTRRPRQRQPVIKVRKSRRQKRKRRQKEKKSNKCSKEDEHVNVCT